MNKIAIILFCVFAYATSLFADLDMTYYSPRGKNLLKPWIIYYSDKAPASTFTPYDPIIFDSDYHPPIDPLTQAGKTVLSYLSLGEVCTYYSYYEDADEDGILLHKNPNWPESYFVDVRNPLWTTRLLEQIIPNLLSQGFNGLFLDTLDHTLYLEESDPQEYIGMKNAAIHLVKTIHETFPDITIMMNRAYALLPDVGTHIQMILGEGVYTDYNFALEDYEKVEERDYQDQTRTLRRAMRSFSHLEVFTLDYWDPQDKQMLHKIYRKQRRKGFRPYVSVIKLNEHTPEP